ncbi:MAG: PIG-L deacetylase family protein [Actinomycetes bacterium]
MTDRPLPPLPEDWSTALAVAAHPDDLEYGVAFAVARWTRAGKAASYLLLTRGEAGIDAMPPEEVAPLREAEQHRAAQEVGVSDVAFADQRDGHLQPDLSLRRDIARAVRRVRPDVLVASASRDWGGVPDQADHRALAAVLVDAVRDAGNRWVHRELAEAEGLQPWDGVRWIALVMDADPTHAVDVTGHVDRGLAALRAHERYFAQFGGPPEQLVRDAAAQAGAAHGVEHAIEVRLVRLVPEE